MAGSSAQMARTDRSRSSLRSASHESHKPPRANEKYSSMRIPLEANVGKPAVRPPSPSFRHFPSTASFRSSQRKGSSSSVRSARPPTPVSKTSMDGSLSSAHHGPQSTFLQEKLQQERRSEIQRSLTRLGDEMDTDNDAKPHSATPARPLISDGKQQDAGPGMADPKKRGLALKETEQTMSTLHKQNFDLKLELFHRRERQTVLEEQVELLEASKNQAEETNVTLLQELEKRDKAVSEAVHMIISLETRIDLLLREREMIRQVESDKAFLSHLALSPSTTLVGPLDSAKESHTSSLHDRKRASNAPNFISGQTTSLEPFQRPYLDSQESFLSFPKTDSKVGNDHGFGSPSNSILSESSFVSVYGPRESSTRDSSVPPDIPLNASRYSAIEGRARRSTSFSNREPTNSRPLRIEALGSQDVARAAMETGEVLSPLRKWEKSTTAPDRHDPSHNPVPDRSETVRPLKQQPLMRPNGQKERPGRKIISDESTANVEALPPTPDTATSSLINHGQHLNNKALVEHSVPSPSILPALKCFLNERSNKIAPNQWRFQDAALSPQAPSFTAFTGRQQTPGAAFPDIYSPRLRRPRSADETTISRHRNGWESDSEFDDAISEVSSFDYWMKDGLQPSHGGAARLTSSRGSANRQASDLFGLPSIKDNWRSGDLLGALGGSSFFGATPALGAVGASLPPGGDAAPPPAPNRNSSLNARTSAPGTPIASQFSSKFPDTDGDKKRSVSGYTPTPKQSNEWNTSRSRSQTPTLPALTQHQQPENPASKRHYPPQASQQHQQVVDRPRSRGITKLFRRSLGSGPIMPTSASVPVTESPFLPPAKRNIQTPQMGLPSRERRNDHANDMASATPPPIVRKRATPATVENGSDSQPPAVKPTSMGLLRRRSSMDVQGPVLGTGLNRFAAAAEEGGAPLTHGSSVPRQSTDISFPPPSHGNGHGRKWFGLGRRASLKHMGS